MKTPKRLFGDWGEEAAVTLLAKKGYDIIDRNYRVRRGEIDIIAWMNQREKTLCFIEVKTRKGDPRDGMAERATDAEKIARIARAARCWCLAHTISIDHTPIQFEQVSVYDTGTGPPEIFHYILPSS